MGGKIPRNSPMGKRGYVYVSSYGTYYTQYPSWVKKRRKTKTKAKKRKSGPHKAIRKSCKTCQHKPAQLKKNPSLHNHHGLCSFRRYHKSYCKNTTCGCQKLKRKSK